MAEEKSQSEEAADLRRRAEETLRACSASLPDSLSAEDARRLIHELRVHQIELELQNEEMQRTHVELETLHARYFDLYDMAPAGYLTVSDKGLIMEANLAAARFFGREKSELFKQPLTRFIFPEDQDIYYRHRKELVATRLPQECDLRMLRKNGQLLWVNLVDTIFDADDKEPVSRVLLTDITERKQLEHEKERLIAELQKAISEIKTIKGYIPICATCKKIKNDRGSWEALEKYFMDNADMLFTHGMCDECANRYLADIHDKIQEEKDRNKDKSG
jgi:PAS domain S-box-containing protein